MSLPITTQIFEPILASTQSPLISLQVVWKKEYDSDRQK